jgi:DNA-directed RNA polymerase subunit RPC12/RpoP
MTKTRTARREAARILARIGDESIVDALVAALNDPDGQVHESVTAALHRIRAEETLLPAPSAGGPDYRFAYLRATEARSRLAGPSYPGEPGEVAIQFPCQRCGSPVAVPLRLLSSALECRCCGSRVRAPAATCYWARCSGTYAECGGSSVERPAAEKAAEEQAALREAGILAAYASAGPTDDWHDEVRELQQEEKRIRDAVPRYKCARCGDPSRGSGQTRCRNVVCSSCARVPPRERLPELDALSRLRQTPRVADG